jgi:phosphatidylglycerophosphatase A
MPWFPGSLATLLAVPLSLALNRMATASIPLSLLTLIAFVGIAAWFCEKGEELFHKKDSRKIVIDEIAGFLLANYLSPAEPKPIVLAFLLFRFFDIIKVFPAARAERIAGGMGVILDDLIAGLYTFLAVRLLFFWSFL